MKNSDQFTSSPSLPLREDYYEFWHRRRILQMKSLKTVETISCYSTVYVEVKYIQSSLAYTHTHVHARTYTYLFLCVTILSTPCHNC